MLILNTKHKQKWVNTLSIEIKILNEFLDTFLKESVDKRLKNSPHDSWRQRWLHGYGHEQQIKCDINFLKNIVEWACCAIQPNCSKCKWQLQKLSKDTKQPCYIKHTLIKAYKENNYDISPLTLENIMNELENYLKKKG